MWYRRLCLEHHVNVWCVVDLIACCGRLDLQGGDEELLID